MNVEDIINAWERLGESCGSDDGAYDSVERYYAAQQHARWVGEQDRLSERALQAQRDTDELEEFLSNFPLTTVPTMPY